MDEFNNNPVGPMTEPMGQSQETLPVTTPSTNPKLRILLWVFVVILVAAIGVIGLILLNSKPVSSPKSNTTTNPTSGQINSQPLAKIDDAVVLIYTEEVDLNNSGNRNWVTVKIWRKAGNNSPEVLAEVGKVGEQPTAFALSPDKQSLLINLESKIKLLNLSTKKLTDVFTAKKQVVSAVFSPDSKQLLIWDQKYPAEDDTQYYLHRLTLNDLKDEIIREDRTTKNYTLKAWRPDNKIVLAESLGESAKVWVYDLATSQLVQTPGEPDLDRVSQNGMTVSVIKGSVPDVCNDFSGAVYSDYSLIDPVSGKNLGTVSGAGQAANILAFNSTGTEALYETAKARTEKAECSKVGKRSYYTANLASGQTAAVSTLAEVLRLWKTDYAGGSINYQFEPSAWSVVINNQTVVISDKVLDLVAQYYK